MNYDHLKIEKKWQKKWQSSKIYKTSEKSDKPKYYILDMFPYPSGDGLHVGHPKGYIATDTVSRMKRMQGFNVLHPMGWDAFGLPAENYAIKTKTNPEIAVKRNAKRFKEQCGIIGLDYDWSREIITTDPEYYKWTQWIFLQMFKKGLAYESNEPINWCPSCKTGLANEDVEDGRCERCGTPVEKKPMRQWVLKITDYAERLLNDLDAKKDGVGVDKDKLLLDWPQSIVKSQKDWIGRSEGALMKFKIETKNSKEEIEVFTTRPDTLFGVTYVVLAPEHKLVAKLLSIVENRKEVEAYISRAKNETEIERTDATKEKTGAQLKGVIAINPVNAEKVSVWISDYVLADYGTGAVMAVPAHDDRDYAFAKKFNLEIKDVILPYIVNEENPMRDGYPVVKRNNVNCILRNPKTDKYAYLKWNNAAKWATFIGGGVDGDEDIITAAKREILEESGYKNVKYVSNLGNCYSSGFAIHKNENRFAFITCIVFDLENEEKVSVDDKEAKQHELLWINKDEVAEALNMENQDYFWDVYLHGKNAFTDKGLLYSSGKFDGKDSEAIMKEITEFAGGKWVTKYKLRDWVFSRQRYWGEPIPVVHCEKCGVVAVPEKDLPVKLPKVKSYEPTGTGESPLAAIDKWVNTKCPQCGGKAKRETNTMPNWAGSSWYYLRYEDPKNKKAAVDPKIEKYWSPVDFYVGGAEHATRHLIYARFWHKFLYDIGAVSSIEPFIRLQNVGLVMGEDGRKMSKRFGNVVNPDDVVKVYGADTLRMYEMFMGPFDQQIAWSTDNMIGTRRFIERVWKMSGTVGKNPTEENLQNSDCIIHKTIKKVTDDITSLHLNTAISSLMIAVNELEKTGVNREQFEIILKLLAPFAPHMTEELWTSFGNKKSIHISSWPVYKPELAVEKTITIAVQVNGKVRGSFEIDADIANGTKTSAEAAEKAMKEAATTLPEIKKWIEGKEIKKVIVIKGKLVSIVI